MRTLNLLEISKPHPFSEKLRYLKYSLFRPILKFLTIFIQNAGKIIFETFI